MDDREMASRRARLRLMSDDDLNCEWERIRWMHHQCLERYLKYRDDDNLCILRP
jgi:hypothetical protein